MADLILSRELRTPSSLRSVWGMTVPLNRDIDHPDARHTAGTMMILHTILHIMLQFEGEAFKL